MKRESRLQQTYHKGREHRPEDVAETGWKALKDAETAAKGAGAISLETVGMQIVEAYMERAEFEESEAGHRQQLHDRLVRFGCTKKEATALIADMDHLDQSADAQEIQGGGAELSWTIKKNPEGGFDIEVRKRKELESEEEQEQAVISHEQGREVEAKTPGVAELLHEDGTQEDSVLEVEDALPAEDAVLHARDHQDITGNELSPARKARAVAYQDDVVGYAHDPNT